MKTLHIILLVAVICIFSMYIQNVYAIPFISPPAKYFNSDIVLIGKVVSSTPFSSTDTKYEIQVEQYLKNPQPQDTLTVIAPGTNTAQIFAWDNLDNPNSLAPPMSATIEVQ